MIDFRNFALQEERLMAGIKKFEPSEQNYIKDALELAKQAHQGQKRDEGDPYIIHPVRVANTLIYDLRVSDFEMIIAALLHDVVEDAEVPVEEIRQKFGEKAARLVEALTRKKEKETKREKFEKTIIGPEDALLIKACDWLDNLRSLEFRTDRGERWRRHLNEAKEMYIPLAKAIGDKWLIEEMEKAYKKVTE